MIRTREDVKREHDMAIMDTSTNWYWRQQWSLEVAPAAVLEWGGSGFPVASWNAVATIDFMINTV